MNVFRALLLPCLLAAPLNFVTAQSARILEIVAREAALHQPVRILGERGGVIYGQGVSGLNLAIFGFTPAGEAFPFAVFPSGRAHGSVALATDGSVFASTVVLGRGNTAERGFLHKMDPAGSLAEIFEFTHATGAFPGEFATELVAGPDGDAFGLTYSTGALANGAVFHVEADGAYDFVTTFSGTSGPAPGTSPTLLRRGTDGALYGACLTGGSADAGTVFKIDDDGTFHVLTNFPAPAPFTADLVLSDDGSIYGATLAGGGAGAGFVFRITAAGAYSVLADFPAEALPVSTRHLLRGQNGNLYGITAKSPLLGSPGSVFRVQPDGTFTTLVAFTGASGARPGNSPTQLLETAGALYGVTRGFSVPDTIFRLGFDGTFTTLLTTPTVPLVQDIPPVLTPFSGGTPGDPLLVGFTFLGGPSNLGEAVRIFADGQVEHVDAFPAGELPHAGLRSPVDGLFYDIRPTAVGVGTFLRFGRGQATETLATLALRNAPRPLAILADGSLLVHDLVQRDPQTGSPLTDYRLLRVAAGAEPDVLFDRPAIAADARRVDANISQAVQIDDTIYCAERSYDLTKLTDAEKFGQLHIILPNGSKTSLAFTGPGGDRPGSDPTELVASSDGWLYGSTLGGGQTFSGVVFRYRSDVGYEKLGEFAGSSGARPEHLVFGEDAALYGVSTTSNSQPQLWRIDLNAANRVVTVLSGGGFNADDAVTSLLPLPGGGVIGSAKHHASNAATPPHFGGQIFRYIPTGLPNGGPLVTTLKNFAQAPIGANPVLVAAEEPGLFFGTLRRDNYINLNQGSLFSVQASGDFQVLYQFEGDEPVPDLLGPDGDGILYAAAGRETGVQPVLYRLNELRKPRLTGEGTSALGPNSATLVAEVTPLDGTTQAWFEYGQNFSLKTPVQTFPASETATMITATLTGFTNGTTISYRAVASNRTGTRRTKPERSFTARSNPPVVRDDLLIVQRGTTVELAVLDNDSDPDSGDVLAVKAVEMSVQGRKPARTSDHRRIIYDVPENFSGVDSFTYTVEDSYGVTANGTARVFSIGALAGTLVGGVSDGSLNPAGNGRITVTIKPDGTMRCGLNWPFVTSTSFVSTPISRDVAQLSFSKKRGAVTIGQVFVTFRFDPANERVYGEVLDGGTTASFDLNTGVEDDPNAPTPDPGLYETYLEADATSIFRGLGGHMMIKTTRDPKTDKGRRKATFSGRLPDGTPFSTTAELRRGVYEIFQPLYRDSKGRGPGGFLAGTLEFDAPETPGPVVQVRGTLRWSRGPALPGTTLIEPDGIAETLTVAAVSHFNASRTQQPDWVVLSVGQEPNAEVQISGGDLPADFVANLTIDALGRAKVSNPALKLKLTFRKTTARFFGSFTHPDPAIGKIAFEGLVPNDSDHAEARAAFAGTTQPGLIKIFPLD
jgi:uncharacterized repeat protein (TIGR03803 family)